ncbi:hypothetical protein RB195_014582 [Necator americanus]|uniref:Uncharacterized protein n=1 Tax=Necator americanus TaxID=51031 RepID=A0ABR1E3H4_NECAM
MSLLIIISYNSSRSPYLFRIGQAPQRKHKESLKGDFYRYLWDKQLQFLLKKAVYECKLEEKARQLIKTSLQMKAE